MIQAVNAIELKKKSYDENVSNSTESLEEKTY